MTTYIGIQIDDRQINISEITGNQRTGSTVIGIPIDDRQINISEITGNQRTGSTVIGIPIDDRQINISEITGNQRTGSTVIGIPIDDRRINIASLLKLIDGYKLTFEHIFFDCRSYFPLHETDLNLITKLNYTSDALKSIDRFGNSNGALNLESGDTISFNGNENTGTMACWNNPGTGWILDFDPEYLNATEITGFTGLIGEIYHFATQIPQSQKTALETITRHRYGEIKNRSYSNLFSGCIAFWPFRYNYNDDIGSHDGTLIGGAVSSIGKFGEDHGSFLFDGIDDGISSTVYPDFPISALTIAFWIYPVSYPTSETDSFACIFAQTIGNYDYNQIKYTSDGNIKISNRSSGSVYEITSLNTCLINYWYHVVVTFDGSTTKIYINGILDSEHTFSSWVNSNYGYYFGCDGAVEHKYSGKLNEFLIFSRCLSESQVSALYNISKTKHITPTIDDNRR